VTIINCLIFSQPISGKYTQAMTYHRPGDLRSSFCELAHQDVFRKSHDVAPLGGIMGCNPRHDGPPNGGPSVWVLAKWRINWTKRSI